MSGVHVQGNQLVDAGGSPVVLRGVNRSGTEYACIQGWGIFDGPADAASVQAIKAWGVNGVNFGLNEDCWLGINGAPASYAGANYINAIKNYAALLEANGIYPVIPLFWEAPGTQKANGQTSMPDADHAPALWTSVANAFKGDNAVIFRLKEEPFPAGNSDTASAWRCWRDGGSACSEGYPAVGMQTLIDTIRATGATNVIQVPGVQYANAMTQFLAYKPTDPLNNLMAVVDVYPDLNPCGSPSCYDAVYAPIIAQMPFMAGEFGESVNGNICGVAKSNVLMDWLDAHNSGYFAWVWDTWGTSCGDLSLILDYAGTPKSPNGTNFKAHLAALAGAPTATPTSTQPAAGTPSPTPSGAPPTATTTSAPLRKWMLPIIGAVGGASATPTATRSPTRTATPTRTPGVPGATRTPTATATAAVGTAAPPAPMPLISRGAPAFASAQVYPAANADDASYDTQWRSNGAAWIAYDLSGVPAAQRGKVVVAWYNNDTGTYDHTAIGTEAYNLPAAYTLEANAAPGGAAGPPSSGWVALASVTGNHLHSRQHAVDLAGYNWLRLNVTAVDGSPQNTGIALNVDVHDAGRGVEDDWVFYGDSITEGAMNHETLNGVPAFAQLVNAQAPGNFPAQEGGGIGYLTSADGAARIGGWLALFPGRYVGLAYGTNDANGGVSPSAFYANYAAMVEAVLAAGKVPVVPTVPWGCTAGLSANVAGLNQRVQALYAAYPQVVRGPDLYGYFKDNPGLISADCIHPSTPAGMGAYRQIWAAAMLSEVY